MQPRSLYYHAARSYGARTEHAERGMVDEKQVLDGQPHAKRRDTWVQWVGGLLLLAMVGGGAAAYVVHTRPQRIARQPRDGPAPRGQQIRDMPIDRLFALDEVRRGKEDMALRPDGGTDGGGSPAGQEGRHIAPDGGAGQPNRPLDDSVSGGDGTSVERTGASPGLAPGSSVPGPDLRAAAPGARGGRSLGGAVPPEQAARDGWFDSLMASLQSPPEGRADEIGDGEAGGPLGPLAGERPGEEELCVPDTGEVPGSAVTVAGRTHLESVDLDADVVIHLLYTLQRTEGLALPPGRAPDLRVALVRLRTDLYILSNLEVSITALLSDKDKEVLLEKMVSADPPQLTLETLDARLSALLDELRGRETRGGCDVPPVREDAYLPRPWRFGFPITALAEGLSGRLEEGGLDPDTVCRLVALLGKAREATADAREIMVSLPGLVEANGLTSDRILRLPKDEKNRFVSSRAWEPVLIGMLDATIDTL